MTAMVTVSNTSYRNNPILHATLPLLKEFKPSPGRLDGTGTITVDASSLGFGNQIRLRVSPDQIQVSGMPTVNHTVRHENNTQVSSNQPLDGDTDQETEEDAIKRISDRFDILEEMSSAASEGTVRSIIVSGPPGVGKSFNVEATLKICSLEQKLNGHETFEVIKGSISPIGLYRKLYQHHEEGQVLVFDDCDSVLLDEEALSLLKAALDTGKKRRLSWNKESYLLEKEGVPDSFDFKGSIIFITNLDFNNVRSNKLRPHLDAMMSRSHYLDLTINTQRDKFLRIKGLTLNSSMLNDYGFSKKEINEILDFVKKNVDKLQELSLRTVLKIADLRLLRKNGDWQALAKVTLMHNH